MSFANGQQDPLGPGESRDPRDSAAAAGSLARLRALAHIERTAILELRGREGEDPLATLAELPDVDEFVVRELRNERLEAQGRLAEFAMARLAAHGTGEEADAHRDNADRAEFAILREIAQDYPELAPAVWTAAGRLGAAAGIADPESPGESGERGGG